MALCTFVAKVGLAKSGEVFSKAGVLSSSDSKGINFLTRDLFRTPSKGDVPFYVDVSIRLCVWRNHASLPPIKLLDKPKEVVKHAQRILLDLPACLAWAFLYMLVVEGFQAGGGRRQDHE